MRRFPCVAAVLLLLACTEKPAEIVDVAGAGVTGQESDHDPTSKTLPEPVAAVLREAKEIQLLSLFWVPLEDAELPADIRGRERIGGYPILGATDVSDHRDQILAAVAQGVAENPGNPFACFNPGHALRVRTADGRKAELIICFECLQVQATVNGQDRFLMYTSVHAAPLLERLLRRGNVPQYEPPSK